MIRHHSLSVSKETKSLNDSALYSTRGSFCPYAEALFPLYIIHLSQMLFHFWSITLRHCICSALPSTPCSAFLLSSVESFEASTQLSLTHPYPLFKFLRFNFYINKKPEHHFFFNKSAQHYECASINWSINSSSKSKISLFSLSPAKHDSSCVNNFSLWVHRLSYSSKRFLIEKLFSSTFSVLF